MAFCEECGAKLAEGVKFCEECGAKVSDDTSLHKDVFEHTEELDFVLPTFDDEEPVDFLQRWLEFAKSAGGELGIIITREDKLLSQFSDGSHGLLDHMLEEYIASAAHRGVKYIYCNLDECAFHIGKGEMENVVASLRKIVDVARPKL